MTTIDGERLDAVLRAIAEHRWVGYKPELSVEQVHELCTVLAPHLSQAAEVRQRDMDHVRDDLLALIPCDRQAGLATAGLGTVLSVAFDHVAVLVWLLAEARHERDVARAALSSRDTTNPLKPADLVREFHAAFGCMMNVPDSRQTREDRNVLHREEHRELVEALGGDEPLTAVAKELADVAFVCYGTALALGIDLDRAVALVHESNMSRLGADGRPVLREDGKVLKGPGYREPDMSGALLPAAAPVGQDTPEPVVVAIAKPAPVSDAMTHNPCCTAHGVSMSCEKYQRTHFVQIRPCCAFDEAVLAGAAGGGS